MVSPGARAAFLAASSHTAKWRANVAVATSSLRRGDWAERHQIVGAAAMRTQIWTKIA
jgi:hypothetical protein